MRASFGIRGGLRGGLTSLALTLAAALPAAAAWEPTKPVEFVVPAGTGGGADQMARLIPVSYTHLTLPTNREV